MTIAVDWDVKPQTKQNQTNNCWHFKNFSRINFTCICKGSTVCYCLLFRIYYACVKRASVKIGHSHKIKLLLTYYYLLTTCMKKFCNRVFREHDLVILTKPYLYY